MTFKNMLEKFVLVYLDDITLYSKNETNHFGHFKKGFIKCKEYGVLLNPRKCVFATN